MRTRCSSFRRRLAFRTTLVALVAIEVLASPSGRADWPTLRGSAKHEGRTAFAVAPEYHRAWAVEFENERLGTAMEPIVARGLVFVATHAGRVHALDAQSGKPKWCFATHGPFLHSPAVADRFVFAASTDGWLYGLEANSGALAQRAHLGRGGAAASPVTADGLVFLGSREGDFAAWQAETGTERSRRSLSAPIRQTAAVAGGRVYVTTEELRLVAMDAQNGAERWRPAPLAGQSARAITTR